MIQLQINESWLLHGQGQSKKFQISPAHFHVLRNQRDLDSFSLNRKENRRYTT